MPEQNSQSHNLDRHNGLILWEKWVLATALGELVSLTIFALTSTIHDMLSNVNTQFILLLVGVLQGLILGFSQWLVLRHYIHNASRWILVTTIGAFFAWLIGLIASMAIAFALVLEGLRATALLGGLALLGAGIGAILGLAQWLVLREYVRARIRQVGWWMAANALAWSLGLLVAFIGVGMLKSNGFSIKMSLISAATGSVMGTVIGVITGIALVWLLKPRWQQHR